MHEDAYVAHDRGRLFHGRNRNQLKIIWLELPIDFPDMVVLLHVILGKSPGGTLRVHGRNAYTLGAQRKYCTATFNRKYGRRKWRVLQWHIRDLSARTSKVWSSRLRAMCQKVKADGATLATSYVCRMVRNSADWLAVRDAKIDLLICEHSGLDTSTPTGEWMVGHMALNAELEAALTGKRTRTALAEAKSRGKLLGTRNPKIRGKSAAFQKARASSIAATLKKFVMPLRKEGLGSPAIAAALNKNPKAIALNGKAFSRGTMQRVLARLAV